jgi:hypothetical protein
MSETRDLIKKISNLSVIFCTVLTLTFIFGCKEEPRTSTKDSQNENANKPPVSSLSRKTLPAITRKEDKSKETTLTDLPSEKNTQLPAVKIKNSNTRNEKPALKPQQGQTASLPDERLSKYGMQNKNPETQKNASNVTIADHSPFTAILQKVVDKNGLVNYNLLKKNIKSLQNYTSYLSGIDPEQLVNKNEKTAFWINTYNAFTLLMVAKNYPIVSVRDLYDGKPWDRKWISINQNLYSLNQIKNDILRKYYFDSRLHFVLSDGSRTGPGLSNKAFTGVLLEPMLEARTMSFINGPLNDITPGQMELNQIFQLYRQDFGRLTPYISRYSVVKPEKNAKISFLEYDWTLNQQ